jgi:HK97 family phage portal protein
MLPKAYTSSTGEQVYDTPSIRKAQVALPPPGGLSRWALLGGAVSPDTNAFALSWAKRQQYAIYYEMYRQHPVVRAAIEKKAQSAVASGYHFKPADADDTLNNRKAEILERFFRRSHSQQLLRLTYKDLDIYGECFWLIIRSIAEARTPMKAMRLNPRFMQPTVKDGVITKWTYGPVSGVENAIDYPVDVILHFKLDDPENDTGGLSPLNSIQRAVAQDIYAMEYNESFFKNSAQTGTIFIVKTSTGDEAKRNREWLEQNYVGPENAHRPLLLEGDVVVEKSVSNPAEMQFLEGRKFLRQEIAMVLEIDLDKLGLHEDSNRSVSKEVNDAFRAESIWPRQAVLEEVINNGLIDAIFGWDDILFQFSDKDPRQTQDQADTMDKNLKSGRESVNEQRQKMGKAPIPGGDVHFIMTPTGIIMVENLPELLKQQAETGMPTQAAGGQGSAGQPSPATGPKREPKTAAQAEATSQKANG